MPRLHMKKYLDLVHFNDDSDGRVVNANTKTGAKEDESDRF